MTSLQTGDILLFFPGSIIGRIAAFFTGGVYSHAALVSVENGTVYCLEIREFLGGRKIELKKYLQEEPATFEVWRLKRTLPDFFYTLVAEKMAEFVGVKYGWVYVLQAVLLRSALTFFGGRFGRRVWRYFDESEKHPPFCSEAVSIAYRTAGMDLCPKIPDRFIFPGDLVKSTYLERVGSSGNFVVNKISTKSFMANKTAFC